MSTPILATKLYIPPPQPKAVLRPRLIERLNEGLHHKLTLISAPAGSGKTTLVSEWVAACERRIAWLSLDEGDNDPARFLTYLVAALRTIEAHLGGGVLSLLNSPQPPPVESLLPVLLNEINTIRDRFLLVLDDYHVIHAPPVDHVLTFLVDHLPPRMHLVIATRENPRLPLARLRVRGQLTDMRAADLRFTPAEAAEFLNQGMGLHLTVEDIAALETRTEGWIAGLQLAALSLQGQQDASGFIQAFTGSHHFVLDYLVEEVLQQQPADIQTFLLHTSILERLCGALCDAVLAGASASGQETLKYLERANLFLVPLDSERRWYRYHHLFADLLRQRLHQTKAPAVSELHRRASGWYEDHGLEIEAFHHAAAAQDVERAMRLIEGRGMPLIFRGAVTPVLNWLESLPVTILDANPSLWVWSAWASMSMGQPDGIEQKLQTAAAALADAGSDARIRDLTGQIAAIRSMLAIPQNHVETILVQSRRALEYLHPANLPVRTATTWALGYAYHMQGNRAAARQAYTEVIAQASGNTMFDIAATSSLGSLQEADNQLYMAAESYRRVMHLAGDPPLPHANGACLGLAHIHYQWNDLVAAGQYGQQSIELARQIESIDTPVDCGMFLARLQLARGDVVGAVEILAGAEKFARRRNILFRLPDVAAVQVLILLRQGNLAAAAYLAQKHELSFSQARVYLAQGDTSSALALLELLQRQAEAAGQVNEVFKVSVLQAVAYHEHGNTDKALECLTDVLALAESGGFIRIFIDEGLPMEKLVSAAFRQGMLPDYTGRLLAAFEAEQQRRAGELQPLPLSAAQSLIEPLSQRELEILQLLAAGLSNREIGERLFLAIDTIKGHNRRIFDKLHVQRRTEAVARAHELGLL